MLLFSFILLQWRYNIITKQQTIKTDTITPINTEEFKLESLEGATCDFSICRLPTLIKGFEEGAMDGMLVGFNVLNDDAAPTTGVVDGIADKGCLDGVKVGFRDGTQLGNLVGAYVGFDKLGVRLDRSDDAGATVGVFLHPRSGQIIMSADAVLAAKQAN